MSSYEIKFPEYIADYEHETEAKGYLVGLKVDCGPVTYLMDVYDRVRLLQDIDCETTSDGFFSSGNILVVPRVTVEAIAQAVDRMAIGNFDGLLPSVQ